MFFLVERGHLQKLRTRVILETAETNPGGDPVKKGAGKEQIVERPDSQPDECFHLLLYDCENSTPRNSLFLHDFDPKIFLMLLVQNERHFSWTPVPSVFPQVLAAYSHHILLIILLSLPVSDATSITKSFHLLRH